MDDSDSELLSDSDDQIDIVAQANKARAAFAAAPQKEEPAPAAAEAAKEEEVAAADDNKEAEAADAEAAEKEKQAEAERIAAEAEAARIAKEKEAAEEAARQEEEREKAEEAEKKKREEEAAAKEAEENAKLEEEEKKRAEAARIAAEKEDARKKQEAEEKRLAEKQKKEEADAKEAEEEKKRAEAQRIAAEKEEERKKAEEAEQQRAKEEAEAKQLADREAAATQEKEEESEDEEEEEEVEAKEEEIEKMKQDSGGRKRSKSTYTGGETGPSKLKQIADKERLDKLAAEKSMQSNSGVVVTFKSDAEKRQEEERRRRAENRERQRTITADIRNTIDNGEKRLTEFQNMKKKGKKKKAWKPLVHGYLIVFNSSFKMKRDKKHKVDKSRGYYLALQLLPQSCNIDENEAEWTKNKKSDSLCPALVAFNSKEKYDEFTKKVAGKNMKMAAGLMHLAQFACGICHLRDAFAVSKDIASSVASLKKDMIRSQAVLPVDSFRGGDSGEDDQFVIVDRTQAFVLVAHEPEDLENWKAALSSVQPKE